MENVSALVNQKNIHNLQKVEQIFANMGYTNYIDILDTKEYGLPQHRERVFMVSILGNESYEFGAKMPLKLKLKNMLSKNVDEKYYLSDSMIDYITAKNDKWTGNNKGGIINRNIGVTLNTKPGGRRCDASDYICDSLEDETNLTMLIKNNTNKGYLEAREGDGIDIGTRMHHHRGNVQKDKVQTLTTNGGNERGVAIKK